MVPCHCPHCGIPREVLVGAEHAEGRCNNPYCGADLMRGMVVSNVWPSINAMRRHVGRVLTHATNPRIGCKYSLPGIAFGTCVYDVWGRAFSYEKSGHCGGKFLKEVVGRRCTSEAGLEQLFRFENLPGLKGGMGRAVLQEGGQLAVVSRVDTTWYRQGHDTNDMEERLMVEFDFFLVGEGVEGGHLRGDWAMINKDDGWGSYVGGCEGMSVDSESAKLLVKAEIQTYPHRLHRRGLLDDTNLCALWYIPQREREAAAAAQSEAQAAVMTAVMDEVVDNEVEEVVEEEVEEFFAELALVGRCKLTLD